MNLDKNNEDRIHPKIKKYSRDQIENAIKFWSMILENKSLILDDLIEVFGYHYVFTGVPVIPTIWQLDEIYKIINRHMFNNELHKIPFIEDDELARKNNALLGYVFSSYSNDEKKIDVLIEQPSIDDDGNKYFPPSICLSKKLMSSMNLVISLASLVAHEMIHQLSIENGNELKDIYELKNNGKEYDRHGDFFKKWMDIGNSKYGLNIQIAGMSIDKSNISSMVALNAFAGNDYLLEVDKKGTYDGKKITQMFIA